MENKIIRPRLTTSEMDAVLRHREQKNNTLFIGDLHAPFILDGYLDFCANIRDAYKCDRIVFSGDIIDNHYTSYHETDPDGHGAAEELMRAKEQIAGFYKEFPAAYVCNGNHDFLPNRKAFSNGISKNWIKDISEVLNVPNWNFAEEWIFDGVLYTHGINRKARQRCQQEFISVAQGHYHGDSYVEYYASEMNLRFALQVGCGIDRMSYAMAYGRHNKKPQINVAVIVDGGRKAFIEPMML